MARSSFSTVEWKSAMSVDTVPVIVVKCGHTSTVGARCDVVVRANRPGRVVEERLPFDGGRDPGQRVRERVARGRHRRACGPVETSGASAHHDAVRPDRVVDANHRRPRGQRRPTVRPRLTGSPFGAAPAPAPAAATAPTAARRARSRVTASAATASTAARRARAPLGARACAGGSGRGPAGAEDQDAREDQERRRGGGQSGQHGPPRST